MRRLERIAARAVARAVARLAGVERPPDVAAERRADGLLLVGRRLRRRMMDDARLRSFGMRGRR